MAGLKKIPEEVAVRGTGDCVVLYKWALMMIPE
jgi:hypothetical protein